MKFKSTRDSLNIVESSDAILQGLAIDGGLYVPIEYPKINIISLKDLIYKSYQEVAFTIIKEFLTDFTYDELKYCINLAYDSKFDTNEIVSLVKVEDVNFLELFHGKTIAFKDMALSILPYLMVVAAKKNNIKEKIVILTATSGDTGKAALEGFANVPGIEIIVLYPKDGVSKIQELQMVTTIGKNVHVIGVNGNFDDCQTYIKNIFNNQNIKHEMLLKGYRFSSANSINVGRLIPQISYYVWAYVKLVERGDINIGDKINIVVPTGNFGNILSAYYAKKIGIPFDKLICASNMNKVLFDFFKTGKYDINRKFVTTSSPSMDILISSNLERLIYEIVGEDSNKCKNFMDNLINKGYYTISDDMKLKLMSFVSGYASENNIFETISSIYKKNNYIIDTHTAVAKYVYENYKKLTGDLTPTVIVSTASPYKFVNYVMPAINSKYKDKNIFYLIDELNKISGVKEPASIYEIRNRQVLHNINCNKEDITNVIKTILGI